MSDDYTAIDIAIIPRLNDIGMILNANAKLNLKDKLSFLFSENKIPHITLYQNFLTTNEIKKSVLVIEEMLTVLDSGFITLEQLSIKKADYCEQNVFSLVCESQNNWLEEWHNYLITRLPKAADLHYPEDQNRIMFHGEVSEKTFLWTKDFLKMRSRNKFSPHMTFGVSRENKVDLGSLITIKSSQFKIVLSQMGECCTVSSNSFFEDSILPN